MSDSLWPNGLYNPWNSPGQITGVGTLSLLQGILPTQGLNPGLPHCRRILYQLSHQGSQRIQEWVAYSVSSRSSQPRNWIGVLCIADRFFTNWAIGEADSTSQFRGHRLDPWSRKIPHAEAVNPMPRHNDWAHEPQLLKSMHPRAQAPQQKKP